MGDKTGYTGEIRYMRALSGELDQENARQWKIEIIQKMPVEQIMADEGEES